MRERPILFNDAMVRAILEGRKTQTRRIMKQQPPRHEWNALKNSRCSTPIDGIYYYCPHGQVGDRLWVRECFAYFGPTKPAYRADGFVTGHDYKPGQYQPKRWRPSIHMPRWASRITLEITNVRVERLQDISEADAIAEGIVCRRIGTSDARTGCRDAFGLACDDHAWATSASYAYQNLWESVYGTESWNSNPWVWVIEFKQLEQKK